MKPDVERAWWCWNCGREVAAEEQPSCKNEGCARDGVAPLMGPLGYRVGHNRETYAYYSTEEQALKDRRLK